VPQSNWTRLIWVLQVVRNLSGLGAIVIRWLGRLREKAPGPTDDGADDGGEETALEPRIPDAKTVAAMKLSPISKRP
jgi:hypothetical protein